MFKSKSSKAAGKAAAAAAAAAKQQAVFKQDYFNDCHRTYSCIHCRAHLANHDELISKLFQGNHGRAYLFNKVVNIGCKQAVQRELLTGLHAVADIYCDSCETTLGWKYEQAFVPSQKYKEGKYIIELVHMLKENNWDLTSYNARELLDEATSDNHSANKRHAKNFYIGGGYLLQNSQTVVGSKSSNISFDERRLGDDCNEGGNRNIRLPRQPARVMSLDLQPKIYLASTSSNGQQDQDSHKLGLINGLGSSASSSSISEKVRTIPPKVSPRLINSNDDIELLERSIDRLQVRRKSLNSHSKKGPYLNRFSSSPPKDSSLCSSGSHSDVSPMPSSSSYSSKSDENSSTNSRSPFISGKAQTTIGPSSSSSNLTTNERSKQEPDKINGEMLKQQSTESGDSKGGFATTTKQD